jgi:hypothetical protein
VPVSAASEAPETEDNQDGDEGKDSLERTSSTTSPPPALSEDLGVDKKRKRVEESRPRVPPLIELWPGKPLRQRMTESSLISWTRECPSACSHILSFSYQLQ